MKSCGYVHRRREGKWGTKRSNWDFEAESGKGKEGEAPYGVGVGGSGWRPKPRKRSSKLAGEGRRRTKSGRELRWRGGILVRRRKGGGDRKNQDAH